MVATNAHVLCLYAGDGMPSFLMWSAWCPPDNIYISGVGAVVYLRYGQCEGLIGG